MVAAGRFAQAALTQAGERNQLAGEFEDIRRVAAQQFQFKLAERLRVVARFDFTQIKADFNAAFAHIHQPLLAVKIGAEQRTNARL